MLVSQSLNCIMSFTVASWVLQCFCACFCPRLGCCDPTKTDWRSKSCKFRPWLGQGPCDFIENSSRCPTKLNWKRKHCFNGKFFVKVIKGLLNDFGARMGPVRLFFFPMFQKNWGLFRQESIQFHWVQSVRFLQICVIAKNQYSLVNLEDISTSGCQVSRDVEEDG